MADQARKVVVLEAVDWGSTSEQTPAYYQFEIVRGMLCGFLISENDEFIVITQQWFDAGDVRNTMSIPKCTIKHRTDLELLTTNGE